VALTLRFAQVREFRTSPPVVGHDHPRIEHITTTRIHAPGHSIKGHIRGSSSIYNRASNNTSLCGQKK
jgi:hypothetical protein